MVIRRPGAFTSLQSPVMRFLLALLISVTALGAAEFPIDLILINGKIWTVNPRQPEAEAVAVGANRIIAVGTSAEISALKQPHTKVIDLHGRRVLPGFNDAHVHFFYGGAGLASVQLRDAKSQAEFRRRLADFAAKTPKGQWITGGNWDHENWSPADLPTHQMIDPVTPDTPVFVSRLDGHMALANSAALKLAGVDRNTKDVPGGVIVRDAEGNPTGILKDAAEGLVEKVIPSPSVHQIAEGLLAAQKYVIANGVTSVQDMSASPEVLRAYQSLLHAGQLHVRVSGHQPLSEWKRLASSGIQADFGSDILHIGGLKGFADGSLGSTTALLFAPYNDAPNTSGIASDELVNPEKMGKDISDADSAGLQVAIHAIGDKANNIILNYYEKLVAEHGERDRRCRIEHAQHLTTADIPRFGKLHVIASMQPYHLLDDGHWAEKRIGPERAKSSYAFRSLLDTGATLAFGSDWPVAPAVPLMGIYAAVTRRTLDGERPNGWVPEQKITVAEAVRAYTMGSAFASFDETKKGSLDVGKLADIVVLSDDIFTIDPVDIAKTKVDVTIFDGEIVYERPK
jgi:predicted amidohydrolase YtcJ